MTMATEAEIRTALSSVQDPELRRSIVDLGMVRDLTIHEGTVTFTLALTIPGCPLRHQMAGNARAAVEALPGVKDVIITLGAMTKGGSADGRAAQRRGGAIGSLFRRSKQ